MKPNFILSRSTVIFVLLVLSASALKSETIKARVETVSGTVEFTAPGSSLFAPLQAGRELPIGTTIRTGDNGAADIITTPGSAIHLGPNSNLRLNALAFAKTGSTVTQREAHLQLNSGVVSALIDPSTPKVTDFQVETPQGAAAARGTFYAVMVTHGKTYVSVERGKVGAMATPKNEL